MGLFSLFRKDRAIVDDEEPARPAAVREDDAPPLDCDQQRDIARAIVLKIDAIEAAMAADMFDEPAFRRPPRRPAPVPATAVPAGPPTEWMDDETPAEPAPAAGEAAILYADGRPEEACRVLAGATAMQPAASRAVWWMLFDLYRLLDRQAAFESLAIDYASVFEASPPAWPPAPPGTGASGGIGRTVALCGVLDASAAMPVERLAVPAEGIVVQRLDVSRITAVEPEGCALLYDALRRAPQGLPMLLAGAEPLLAQARSIVDVGRRDTGQAPWLLILELLRMCGRAREFDEAALDYGITFGVPPPPFSAPASVACVPGEPAGPDTDRYLLPALVEGDAAELWPAIRAYAERCPVPVLDGSWLARIDRAAAAHLLALLRELAAGGHRVELRELNHMVATLLELQGCGGTARLLARRW